MKKQKDIKCLVEQLNQIDISNIYKINTNNTLDAILKDSLEIHKTVGKYPYDKSIIDDLADRINSGFVYSTESHHNCASICSFANDGFRRIYTIEEFKELYPDVNIDEYNVLNLLDT
jgi:hypothetical protein